MSMLCRVLAFLLSCCLVGLPASPAAAAAPETGQLILKAKGAGYTGINTSYGAVVGTAVRRGGASTYQARLVNYGDEAAHFKLALETYFRPATYVTKADGADITSSLTGSGYITPLIEPGDHLQVSVRVKPQLDSPPAPYDATVTLLLASSTDDVLISSAEIVTMFKAPAHETSGAEVYARHGSQPWVGGTQPGYFASSPVVREEANTTFKVKIQNDGLDTHQIRAGFEFYNPDCFSYSIKRGSTDITDDIEAGTYITPPIKPGRYLALKLTVRWHGLYCLAGYGAGAFTVTDLDEVEMSVVQFAVMLPAVIGDPPPMPPPLDAPRRLGPGLSR